MKVDFPQDSGLFSHLYFQNINNDNQRSELKEIVKKEIKVKIKIAQSEEIHINVF